MKWMVFSGDELIFLSAKFKNLPEIFDWRRSPIPVTIRSEPIE
jgi:hypothetical protein